MLSYRHGFHAGNPGDLLKHSVLVLLLEHLKKKEKGFCVYDTHAGAGLYDLNGEWALKNGEFNQGIGKVWENSESSGLPEPFLKILKEMNPGTELKTYPGSPEIARRLLRPQDHLVLMELHNNEVDNLRETLGWDPKVSIHHRDGFEGSWSLVPPDLRRGFVFMDPSYELKDDYLWAMDSLKMAYKRWDTGIYALWYPLLGKESDRSQELLEGLSQGKFKTLLRVELETSPQKDDWGMYGSGMAIINVPYNLDLQLQEMMPALAHSLGEDSNFRVEWLIRENARKN